MTTVAELRNARNIAGVRYAAALNEFHAALIDLAAMDTVYSTLTGDCAPGFGPLPPHLAGLFHHQFAPSPSIPPNLHDAIAAKRDEISKSMERI